jgi:hypothetical protein
MKKIVLLMSVVTVALLAGVALQMRRQEPAPITGGEPKQDPIAPSASVTPTTPGTKRPAPAAAAIVRESPLRADSMPAPLSGVLPADSAAPGAALVLQAIDTLLSPQSYDRKQSAWKQLAEGSKLDPAIKELERRMTENPHAPEIPATLGQAYLQKCATIQDVREQGILAMKADQVFDAALNLDASNWEARFTKAMAMSYWPTQMNKGNEVIEHFATLITQQETQPPQSHFAQSYLWLGKEYEKYGRADYARGVWQRGLELFPQNQELRARLQEN